MRKLLLLLVVLLVSGSLLLLLPEASVAQGWEPSGTIGVGPKICDFDSECGTGNECYAFDCRSCSGSCLPCGTWQGGGGCGCVNAFEDAQDGCSAGWWCESGTCVNCRSPGGACDKACCDLCDASTSVCVQCDANNVQTNPPVAQGGGKCEESCGASSQCDELAVGTFVASGICNLTCQYVDGDPSPPANCEAAVGPGHWNLGGEVAATTCCGDDAGENTRSRETGCTILPSCALNDYPEFSNDPADDACCNNPNDAVFNSACFTDDNGGGGPYLYSGGAVSVAVGAPNTIAENGKWYDCDNSLGACTESKSTGRCGLTWVAGGEAAAFGEYATGTSTECCGDDAGENSRSRETGCTIPGCAPNGYPEFSPSAGDAVCCNNPNDAVFNSACFTDDNGGGGPYLLWLLGLLFQTPLLRMGNGMTVITAKVLVMSRKSTEGVV
ncbi:hypothetical protein HYV83_05255 [Candidatus Woesearchaeota archaeon]|nr:hypothetical protein [Candidatus Woesearchaeota archaeon]